MTEICKQIYIETDLDNGDVFLKKKNNKYDSKFYTEINLKKNDTVLHKNACLDVDTGDILLQKKTSIHVENIETIKMYCYSDSTIISCSINDDSNIKLNYKKILEHVYKIINDGAKIIKYSLLNIKTTKQKEKYYHLEELGIYIPNTSNRQCLMEIVNQCIENIISIKMTIKLNNGVDTIYDF